MACALAEETPKEVFLPRNFADFCDKYAKFTGRDFAVASLSYVKIQNEAAAKSYETMAHFLDKYIEYFQHHFNYEVDLRIREGFEYEDADPARRSPDKLSQQAPSESSPKSTTKSFFRRLSFKGLRRSGIFKQQSDDGEPSSQEKEPKRKSKIKLSKITVECRKEGLVKYLIGDPDDEDAWQLCRLQLIKTVGGYLLEFYCPPKTEIPKWGLFCYLIVQARSTSPLEMPDNENTFVLKADTGMEYIIEAPDFDEKRFWLATIRYCMRSDMEDYYHVESRRHRTRPAPTSGLHTLPPASDVSKRRDTRVRTPDQTVNFNPIRMSLTEVESDNPLLNCDQIAGIIPASPGSSETEQVLKLIEYPWFHGLLPRNEAARLVLRGGAQRHGAFLVRQSETRLGEFVLTFNYQGKPKHLRMTLTDQGMVTVQHMWFSSMFEVLEYFREHTIPLESGTAPDIYLTDYVIRYRARISAPMLPSTPIPEVSTTVRNITPPVTTTTMTVAGPSLSSGENVNEDYVYMKSFPEGPES